LNVRDGEGFKAKGSGRRRIAALPDWYVDRDEIGESGQSRLAENHRAGGGRPRDHAGSHNRDWSGVFSFGPFRLHVIERLLKRGDEVVPLARRAFDLLIALVEQAGKVVGQNELTSRVWPDVTVEEANRRVQITALRRALGDGHAGARYVVNFPAGHTLS
jgi:DNA-binding response OmpR family regulator